MIGGDRIPEDRQRLGRQDVLHRRRRHGQPLKVWRVGDIGAAGAPLIGFAARHIDRLPMLVALVNVGIAGLEHRAVHAAGHGGGDLFVGGPDVLQEHVLPGAALADRRGGEVFDHRALQRIGHHQRRAGEEVCANIRRHAPLKVAVARDYRGGDEAVLVDRLADRFGQGAGVADAGGAAVTHQVETDGIEMLAEAGLVEVVGDHLRSGGQRGFHPRGGLQAQLVGLLGHQAGGD